MRDNGEVMGETNGKVCRVVVGGTQVGTICAVLGWQFPMHRNWVTLKGAGIETVRNYFACLVSFKLNNGGEANLYEVKQNIWAGYVRNSVKHVRL